MSTEIPNSPGEGPPQPAAGEASALTQRLAEFLTSPLVLAGGALLAGAALVRLVGADNIKALAAQLFPNHVPPPPPVPVPPPAPPPPPSPQKPSSALDELLPQAGEFAKKVLAEIFARKQ